MQKKLLDHALLTSKELDWLDDYHKTVSGVERPRTLVRTIVLTAFDRTRRIAVRHNLNRVLLQYFRIPGLDETEQAGGGRRGACMVEGSDSAGDKAAIATRRPTLRTLITCLL